MAKKKIQNKAEPATKANTSTEKAEETDINLPTEVSEWFESGRIAILNSIEERSSGSLKDKKKTEEAKTRLKDLSTGSDVVGVSFAGDPLQHLYYSTKFERRGILMYAILSRLLGNPQTHALAPELFECRRAIQPLLTHACGRPTLQVVSVGGGPVSSSKFTCFVSRSSG
jgi:hypothetical protein